MITVEEFLSKVKEAKEAVQSVDEEYRASAFQVYLTASLGATGHVISAMEPVPVFPSGIPHALIQKLDALSSRDIIFLLLRYEKTPMTREEMVTKSAELGKPLTPAWMSNNFATKTKGSLVESKEGEKTTYRLSTKAGLDFDTRVKNLLGS